MNKQDDRETNNQEFMIEDLTINEDHAAEVKGGIVFVGGWGASSYQY